MDDDGLQATCTLGAMQVCSRAAAGQGLSTLYTGSSVPGSSSSSCRKHIASDAAVRASIHSGTKRAMMLRLIVKRPQEFAQH